MSDHTEISWTDATWPVTTGCTEVSPGCDNCYAARLTSGRLKHLPEYAGLAVGGKFTGEVRCHPQRLDWPLKWHKPRRVFVCSMSDLFHDKIPDSFIAKVFAVMGLAPTHTFQVLTKRHARIRSLLGSTAFRIAVLDAAYLLVSGEIVDRGRIPRSAAVSYWSWREGESPALDWPLPNVWLGVSVETQQWADIRIPVLLDTPAAVRWISAEPLLGPVDLSPWIDHAPWHYTEFGVICACGVAMDHDEKCLSPQLNWVVCGGESGAGARPMHPDWARQLRDQCQSAGIAYHHKQWGEWVPPDQIDSVGYDDVAMDDNALTVWPDGRTSATQHPGFQSGAERMWHVGKKAAGRLLDGREWSEYP